MNEDMLYSRGMAAQKSWKYIRVKTSRRLRFSNSSRVNSCLERFPLHTRLERKVGVELLVNMHHAVGIESVDGNSLGDQSNYEA